MQALGVRIKGFFQPRPNRFLVYLRQQATLTVAGTDALVDYMTKPSSKNAARVRQLEKEADEQRRILIDELNRTFVTPIDREDIFALSRVIDDVLDYAYSMVNEMDVLAVTPTEHLRKMAQLLRDAAEEIRLAMDRLEHNPNVADDHAVRAKAIENRMEALYAEALADLFRGPKDLNHVVEMLKLREIYRHMFHAGGAGDEAANIISDIVVKSS